MDKNWLKQQLEPMGRGAQAALARHLGLSLTVTNKLINGTRKISAIEADKIREYLQLHGGGHASEATTASAVPPTNARPAFDAPPLPGRHEMPRDLPVLGTGMGGDGDGAGDFEMNGQVVDYVRRPPRLIGRNDVFGLYLVGDSMRPWRKPGGLIVLERRRAPSIGDYVCVELKPHDAGDNTYRALVKELIGVSHAKIRLRQYNPLTEFEIDRRRIAQIIRILDWDELMGF